MEKNPQFAAMAFKSRQNTRINNTSKGQELIRDRTKDHVWGGSCVPLRSLEMCPAPQAFSTAGELEQLWICIVITKFWILSFISWPRGCLRGGGDKEELQDGKFVCSGSGKLFFTPQK